MGRNKFSQKEIEKIGKLLRLKNSVNRGKQKLIRHELRVDYEFNISDFNEPGKAFGEEELRDAVKRGAIQILDEATIEAMKAKRAREPWKAVSRPTGRKPWKNGRSGKTRNIRMINKYQ